MRKVGFILVFFVIVGCNSEKAIDCIQTPGKEVVKELDLPVFEEIMVYPRVKLYLTAGPSQKVIVKTNKNLLPEVEFLVQENRLVIQNKNTCNLVRDYKTVEVYVTSPNLSYIQNGSQWTIESTNVLTYSDLTLISENYQENGEYHTDGNFKLNLDCEKLRIVNNNISNYYLQGKVDSMFVGFYSGNGRLEAGSLEVEYLQFYHRSSNDMIVNPQQSLRGEIRSTGNVISVNQPPVVEVEEFYTGRLIFD